jgi:uncharacterized protein
MEPDLSAALTPEALGPGIARSLGLSEKAVIAALTLLATGSQPAFVARFRSERVRQLGIRDLERIQARAAQAVAFEFRRQQVWQELSAKGPPSARTQALLASAATGPDLDDLRGRRGRKKGPGAAARGLGLAPLADALWARGRRLEELHGDAPPEGHDDAAHDEAGHDEEPSAREPSASARVEAPMSAARDRVAPEFVTTDDLVTTADELVTTTDDIVVTSDELVTTPDVVVNGHDATPPSEADPADEATPDTDSDTSDADASTSASEPAAPAIDPAERARAHRAAAAAVAAMGPDATPAELAAPFVGPQVPDVEAALAGARTILADRISGDPMLRRRLRNLTLGEGRLVASVADGKKDKGGRWAKLAERPEPIAKAGVGIVLALHRGEREGAIHLRVEVPEAEVLTVAEDQLSIAPEGPHAEELVAAVRQSWEGPLGRAVIGGARKLLKQRIDRKAIAEYCDTLRPLLLAPAFGKRPVLGIDPGHQPGCRLAVVGADGTVLASDTVFPLTPKLQAPQAKARIAELLREHEVAAIAVTNAGGGRDVERLCREAMREAEPPLQAVITSVDADSAALYASSRQGKEELPEADAALRRAVSAARRLQDPLLELTKVDPRKLGLGQYQHEVEQEELRGALEQVVTSCVNEVSVDANTAPVDRLARVCGLSVALAKAVVAFREQNGPFRTRAQLLDVPGLAGKAFEQSAGFLRVYDGDHPLDRSAIHPERYGQVTEMARDLGVTVADLVGNAELVDKIDREKWIGKPGTSGEPLGAPTFDALVAELREPGKDPRPPFQLVEFDPGLASFEDLKVGMDLPGVVTHMAGFGAFVDVGLSQEALVHVSELSHGFISSPFEAVHVGQRVRGRVIEIDPERKRFSLSLRALMPRPERPATEGRGKRRKKGDAPPREGKESVVREGGGRERGDRDRDRDRGDRGDRDRDRDRDQGKPRGGKGGRGPRDRGADRDKRPQKQDRVLEFRMDLSSLADLLDKR